MFENFLIRSNSLRNEKKDDKIIGFTLAVRHANYRGVYLSLHNGYYIEVDAREYPREAQQFEINGQPPRSFEDLKAATSEHWDYDDEAILHVASPGGLAPGMHTIRFQQSVLAAYGYLPTDEEWVRNPPKPGSGAGSDKTPQIVAYSLVLNTDEESGQ
ncbi:C-glycoside deglycosidase beta subunit domain-containing protein [Consotaella aegiceratis]|uniref:C-glycoside deglycosidase beta subunit domain-containing protein n=1 Tax=Consotaella aegiceratis TaxID=3097961 RepID=UPI002F3ECCD1